MKMKFAIELSNPNSCSECPLLKWDDNDLEYRCCGQSKFNIYFDPDTCEYVNRDKCPLVPDNCCGGSCCKK